MIYVDRHRIPEPKWLKSNACKKLRAEAEKFFKEPLAKRKQTRFDFETGLLRIQTKDELLNLFHRKCAFCEQKLAPNLMGLGKWDLEHFRPKQVADDDQARDHYWWLHYAWTNLYAACPTCNRSKRNLFPVEGKRSAVGAMGAELSLEKALLIDPCLDRPEEFLSFDDSGMAMPSPSENRFNFAERRAQTVISTYELNRKELVKGRLSAIQNTFRALENVVNNHDIAPEDVMVDLWNRLQEELAPEAEFASAKRFACARQLLKGPISNPEAVTEATLPRVELGRYFKILRSQVPALKAAPLRRRVIPAADIVAPVPEHIRSAVVNRVEISNYRIIETLSFDVAEDASPEVKIPDASILHARSWKMLLGENGSGKSSVLHGIALALMGKKFYEEKKEEYGFANNLRFGSAAGEIKVWLSGDSEPLHLKVLRDKIEWVSGERGASIFLRGYGASRLLPKRRRNLNDPSCVEVRQSRNVDNLFDPFAPLIDAEGWLRSLNPEDFYCAATNLKALLDVKGEEVSLGFEDQSARSGRFGLWEKEHFTPLEYFSAGYQTLLALGCDIMAGTNKKVEDMISTPGVILIDEIGTNLHPRWRMEIIMRLRKTFPAMQFIASTHEPLCLRGLGKGEVAVMRVEKGIAELVDNLRSPAGLRVDQLLTSEFFGLNTTIDPQVEAQFTQYYDLLERKASLTATETGTLETLKKELADKSVLGSSRRDRLILDILDQFIVSSRAAQKTNFPKPTKDVVTQIEAILKAVQPSTPLRG
ncbi:MAG: hypothetical protein JWM68_1395 [Verrucomicrobiales bacterium]|nr:hypothetical protein [Verrucomicrobiales bacterium]